MTRLEQGRNIRGVPLGTYGDPIEPILEQLQRRGLSLHPKTISRLRSMNISGVDVDYRLHCEEVLAQGSAILKDKFYLDLAQRSQRLQIHQVPPNDHRLSSEGHTEELATDLDINSQEVRRIIRAMRADIAFGSTDRQVLKRFISVAENYIDVYTRPGASNYSFIQRSLSESWDGRTIVHFYQLLYQGGARAIGTWVPYECEAMAEFYKQRVVQGNDLTKFDRKVLEAGKRGGSDQRLVDEVRLETGIEIDRNVTSTHNHALLYGKAVFLI